MKTQGINMLVPIDKHCVAIALILSRVQELRDWEGVQDWLMTAGSIKSVEVDTIQHDEGFGWCSTADEFSMAREELLNEFVFDLTVFNFSWGALEAVIDAAAPPKHPDKAQRGKIRDACYLLEQAFAYRGHVIGLADEVQSFREAALECLGARVIERRLSKSAEIGLPGLGLYAVYELRNQFAHGALRFPFPDEENRPESAHRRMVTHATRVVLMQIQMLLLAELESESELIINDLHDLDDESDDDDAGRPLWWLLRSCHLARTDRGDSRSLFKI